MNLPVNDEIKIMQEIQDLEENTCSDCGFPFDAIHSCTCKSIDLIKENAKIIERHNRITFYEDIHKYELDTQDVDFTSVTTFIGQFHEHFDAEAISTKMSKGCEIKKAGLLYEWGISSHRGTYIHKLLELYIKGEIKANDVKDAQFKKGVFLFEELKKNGWEVFMPEIILWSKKYKLCGTLDLIMIKDGKLYLLDWKTCKSIDSNDWGKYFYNPLNKLLDNKQNHYNLQLSVYKVLLKEIGDYNIAGMALLHIPENGIANIIKCDDLSSEVNLILKTIGEK